MIFNKEKCKVQHVGRNNLRHQYTLGADWPESSFAKKDLGVLTDTEMNMNKQRVLAAKMPTASWAALGRLLSAGQGR